MREYEVKSEREKEREQKEEDERVNRTGNVSKAAITLPSASQHRNTPVLAVDGVAVSWCVHHSQAKLNSPFFYLHGRRLNLYGPLDLLCEKEAQKAERLES